jgi:gluconolactonase
LLNKIAFVSTVWLCVGSVSPGIALALLAGGFPACRPAPAPAGGAPAPAGGAGPQTAAAGRGAAAPRVPREAAVTAIAGVVAADAKWTKVWQSGGNSADGLVADRDGNILTAQEDFDAVLKFDAADRTSVAVAGAKGIGSLSIDRQGRLYGAHRTERPGSTKPDRDAIVNAITLLAPQRKTLADKWTDGTPLTVRPNDLVGDSKGGVYFTSGCVYYAGPMGTVSVAAEMLRTNGIALSLDDKTLYVTNGGGAGMPGTIVAFDITGAGKLTGRRVFATLAMGNGDGLALDSAGRLYVTSNPGVQVFDAKGTYLGLIPTPRGVISVAFGGRDRNVLYVVGSGADDANGQPIREGPQQTAATVYKLPVVAKGIAGRGK